MDGVLFVTNYGTRVTTAMDGIEAACSLYRAALRLYGVKELAELSAEARDQLLADLTLVLRELGLYDVCVEWREERKERTSEQP